MTPTQALERLKNGNSDFIKSTYNPAAISAGARLETANKGQRPYAAIMTCSDSRTAPEHIFSAGLGELFVVRTGGHVVGPLELGSLEFSIKHFEIPLIVVMGHLGCSAVAAAMAGKAEGYIDEIAREIRPGLRGATDWETAVRNNVTHAKERILSSEIITDMVAAGQLDVVGSVYDIVGGGVEFS
jgi:carbonic anhydrase